jgi:hypothetical protein
LSEIATRPAVQAMNEAASETIGRKRRSRVPVGESLVMTELLKRGFGAQLTGPRERILLIQTGNGQHTPVRVKTTRGMPWYLRRSRLVRNRAAEAMIFVLLGSEERERSARFFVTSRSDIAALLRGSSTEQAFVSIDAKLLKKYEDKWSALKVVPTPREKR